MRYDFECAVCKAAAELDVKLADAPKVGERHLVSTDTLACPCGSRAFTRVMDRKTGGFKLNFRQTGL
jgi:hypothetical protein